ncbi:MAG: hypothetical protein RLY20_900 [Verrucomicrobiota bacterium]|jgi:glycosyltransferase involved in cell wall biosynthesis
MADKLAISIIICTCNRAAGLRETLAAMAKCRLRPEWAVELVVVDNASQDETLVIVRDARVANVEIRYVYESKRGKANALNTGLKHAKGNLLLFTDDDVLVSADWIEQMVEALQSFDAVTGKITLAPTLLRPWLTPKDRWWLASSEDAKPREGHRELIGANMGFWRRVLDKVPAFDAEIGPGAIGLGEDSLFGWQLVEAGFKIGYASNAEVLHLPDARRLQRACWLDEVRKHARTDAYLSYHWEHADVFDCCVWAKKSFAWARLWLRRIIGPLPPPDAEGWPRWEAGHVQTIAYYEQLSKEKKRPRNYEPRGLVKRNF